MDSKRKSSKKRVRESDSSEKLDDVLEKIELGAKKRKSNKDDVRSRKFSKSNNSRAHKKSCSVTSTKTMTVNSRVLDSISAEVCIDTTVGSINNDYLQCLAGHVRKTYALGSSKRQARKDRLKARGSVRSRLNVADNDDGKREKISDERSTRRTYLEYSKNVSTIYTGNGVKLKESIDNPRHKPAVNSSETVAATKDKNKAWKSKGIENEVQILSDCTSERRKISKTSKSTGDSTSDYESASSSSQQMGISSCDVTPIVFSTMSSPSHMVGNPVTCSMTPILCHTTAPGVPIIPVPSLNANTSAITSVSTPIVTLPLLPDMTHDVSGSLRCANSIPNSVHMPHQTTYAPSQMNNRFTSANSTNQIGLVLAGSNIMYDRTASHISASRANIGVSNGKGLAVHASDSITVESAPEKNTPVISIEDDSETLIIEKTSTSPTLLNNKSRVELTEEDDSTESSFSTSSSESTFFTPTTLKVDNWGAYLLQRLEMLFDREEECDLILKFSSGEILKAHRPIISACTSLLTEPQREEQKAEVAMPPELDYASVEPVLRFVYSGRLVVGGSKTQLAAIYIASQRLQVSLLTRLLDRRYPYLTHSRLNSSSKQQNWNRTLEKSSRHRKQRHGKGNGKNSKSSTSSGDQDTRGDSNETGELQNSGNESLGTSGNEEEVAASQDGSLYFLVTNSQKIAQANAAVRRKRPAETARPTRFELEEESDHNSVQIATWSSSSSLPSCCTSSPCDGQESSILVSTAVANSAVNVSSPNNGLRNTNVTWSSSAMSPDSSFSLESVQLSNAKTTIPTQDTFSLLTQEVQGKSPVVKSSVQTVNNRAGCALHAISGSAKSAPESGGNAEDDDTVKESEELMEKISNICKQLEDGDSDENESSCEELYEVAHSKKLSVNTKVQHPEKNSQLLLSCTGEHQLESSECIVLDGPDTPTKSILKKKKEKYGVARIKKRVSFPLDENNELINEVATYSNSKEPAQSLIDVQKTTGSFRSSEDSSSPVKLTLSLKKKVLMNLTLDDSDSGKSHTAHDNEKGKGKKESYSSGQSTSQGISQGDMSNHAKIISEVLKKYPHLVKDRKNIRLKILKKGTDKSGSGKLVKSKVQYLVLSDSERKTKSSTKYEKTSAITNKADGNTSRAVQNAQSFECSECEDAVFSSYFALKKHIASEHKEKISSMLATIENVPYACYTCFVNEPLEFSDYSSYQQHMKEMHSKRETRFCSICGYRPGRKLELAYHQYIEHNKLPRNVTFPKCDLCDHVAMNDAALLKHRSKHANADNYTCSVCGVAFRSFGALQGHMQTKLCQNKPSVSHKCPYCPQTFARSYNLKAHCKSNHRAAYLAAQAASNSAIDSRQQETLGRSGNKLEVNGSDVNKGGLAVERMCETLTNLNNPSSSEAEALSTVANSLAASLGLPEETVNHYMYSQGNKLEFAGNHGDESCGARSADVNAHLLESSASVAGYSGNLPLCHAGNYNGQTSISTTTAVGTFYPVGVVPSQIVPSQIVSGEILPSQVLPGACVNVASSAVLGASPHSWTYVTYQVPTSGEELPTVISDTTNIAPVVTEQSTCTGVDLPMAGKSSKNESSGSSGTNSITSNHEPPNPLVVMTNTATQVSISHGSHLSTPQMYDAFSSQFV